MKIKPFIIAISVIIFGFYSFSIGRWGVFPYPILKSIYHLYRDNIYATDGRTLDKFQGIGPDNRAEIWDASSPDKKMLANSILLNNFKLNWKIIDNKNIGKTATVKLINQDVLFLNQDSKYILHKIMLNEKNKIKNLVIKSAFEYKNKTILYILYIEGKCVTAKLLQLEDNKTLIKFNCLPMKFAEFNGAGGALLKLNESEFLLGTGVPVKARANSEIYKDAQNDKSYWGKILKLDFSSGNLKISIFSKGFRNPQGITKLDGNLYTVEHGPHGGDEINLIVEGGNYGWPIQSFGSEYDFQKIEKYYIRIKNNKLPLYTFMPSIGISDISKCPINYTSYYHPFSCLAVSSLRDGSIYFLVFDKNKVFFTERMNFNYRIRKLFVSGDKIFGVTDYAGIIAGRLSELH